MKILLSILLIGFGLLVTVGCEGQADDAKKGPADTTVDVAPEKVAPKPVKPTVKPVKKPAKVVQTPPVKPKPVKPKPVMPKPATPKPVVEVKIAPDTVIAKVNDIKILEADVATRIKEMEEANSGRQMPPERLASWRKSVRPQVIDTLIKTKLVDIEAKSNNISVTEKDIDEALEKSVQDVLTSQKWTREEFAKQIKERTGMTLEESMAKTKASSSFREYLLTEKLLEMKYADQLKVVDKDVEEFYTTNLDKYFKQDEQVKASHILLSIMDKARKPLPEAEKQAAKVKAQEVLKEVKAPGADFTALAKKYSTCPSAANGGDLGFFPRTGKMVEAFAKAAFETKVGETTDIVETQFGYHIIKVTEKKEAGVTPLAEVKDKIKSSLVNRKKGEVTQKFYQDLKAKADIVNNEKPAAPPKGMPRMQMPPKAAPKKLSK